MFISSVLSYHIIVSFLSQSDNFRNYFLPVKKKNSRRFFIIRLFFFFIGLPIYSLSDIRSISLKNYTDSLINKEYDQRCQCIFKYTEWENDHCCKCTSKDEVCHITYICCHRSLCYQMHKNLHQLDQYTCDRFHCKWANQHRDFVNYILTWLKSRASRRFRRQTKYRRIRL